MSTEQPTQIRTLIIGGGFSGLCTAIQMRRRGDEEFLILERSDNLGGTWWFNTYPGVACDIPSPLYSFSFAQNPEWTKLFADGGEIHEYQVKVARDEGIMPFFRFNTEVSAMHWNEDLECWDIETSQGAYRCDYLILAMGHLAGTHLPDVEGLDTFPGPAFHSARWRHDVEVTGKRVGVVGTGASSIQLVPALAGDASEVVVFQRTPPWVLPRVERNFTEAERTTFRRNPGALDALRNEIFWQREGFYANIRNIEPYHSLTKELAAKHLAEQVPDLELRKRLTPTFEPGCKRLLLSNTYYPALQRDDVTLETSALARVVDNRAVAASGNEYELDVLVFATGFDAGDPPYTRMVYGEGGELLADRWATGMQAMDSATVAGYPNMFIIDGPNTALGHNSIIYIIESQVEYTLDAIDHIRKAGGGVLRARREVEDAYVEELTEISQETVFLTGGCSSWYLDQRSGRQTLVWPGTAAEFRATNVFRPEHYELLPHGAA